MNANSFPNLTPIFSRKSNIKFVLVFMTITAPLLSDAAVNQLDTAQFIKSITNPDPTASQNKPVTMNSQAEPMKSKQGNLISDRNLLLTMVILSFGLIIIGICALLVRMDKLDEPSFLKAVTISIACTSSLILVVAGYSTEQIAPAFGLLGTLVGYLLGQKTNNSKKPL
ncbi:hypothetical protein [Dyadobacter bucti]|uniref:hypothetical protein n=1 Tax=Dyadobacter bucti TaxID=2572203 RepID=UPI0011084DA5|nr:hypothetical protein [Dyadobacter bucti]